MGDDTRAMKLFDEYIPCGALKSFNERRWLSYDEAHSRLAKANSETVNNIRYLYLKLRAPRCMESLSNIKD